MKKLILIFTLICSLAIAAFGQQSIPQSTSARALVFFMADSSDHVTGKTGLSPTVTLSKNGAAFGAASGAVTELSSGWYKLAGNTTDSNTLGALVLHATGTGADPTDKVFVVVAQDDQDAVRMGLTALPNVAQGNSGALATLSSSGSLSVTAGRVTAGGGTIDLANATGTLAASQSFNNVGQTAALPSDTTKILGTAITEGAGGRLAAAFVKLFNVSSPTGTVNSLPDAVPGAANGVVVNATGQAFNNTGQTTAQPADITKYSGTASKWGTNAPGDVHSGTSQGSGDPSEITLAAGASSTDNVYVGELVAIVSGTGAGQTRVISDYTGTTRVASVSSVWTVQPDNTSVYAIRAFYSPSISDTLGVNVSFWSGTQVEGYATSAQASTIAGYVDTEVAAIFARLGAPAGASIAADIATRAPSATALSTAEWTTLRATSLDNLDALISSRLASATNATSIASIKTVTDALNSTLEVDGLVYRFTLNALEQAPAGGGGGGFTTDDRTLLEKIGAKQGVRVP